MGQERHRLAVRGNLDRQGDPSLGRHLDVILALERLSIESERYSIAAVLSDDVSGTNRAVVTFTDDPALAGGGRRTPSVEDSGTGGVGARSTSTGRTALEASRNLSPPATAAGPSPDNTSVEHEPRTGRTSSPPRTAT